MPLTATKCHGHPFQALDAGPCYRWRPSPLEISVRKIKRSLCNGSPGSAIERLTAGGSDFSIQAQRSKLTSNGSRPPPVPPHPNDVTPNCVRSSPAISSMDRHRRKTSTYAKAAPADVGLPDGHRLKSNRSTTSRQQPASSRSCSTRRPTTLSATASTLRGIWCGRFASRGQYQLSVKTDEWNVTDLVNWPRPPAAFASQNFVRRRSPWQPVRRRGSAASVGLLTAELPDAGATDPFLEDFGRPVREVLAVRTLSSGMVLDAVMKLINGLKPWPMRFRTGTMPWQVVSTEQDDNKVCRRVFPAIPRSSAFAA